MKTRTKKCGVFAALAVTLLITAALITNCVEPVNYSGLASKEKKLASFTPPEGMGYIKLEVLDEGSKAKSVLPGAAPTIAEYIVVATNSSTSAVVTSPRIAATAIASTPVVVPAATYNVEVRGYATTGATIIVAVGSDNGVVVSAGTGGTATVVQRAVVDGTGSGTFAWNFTFPTSTDAVDGATMTVSNWGSGTNAIPGALVGATLNPATATGSESLPSGYYYVDVTLVKASHRSQTYREIVHIANTLTSTWSKSNFHPLGRNIYTVTYRDVDGDGATNPVTGQTHGSLLTEPATPVDSVSGRAFDGWYRDTTFLVPWVFASDRIIYDLDLYANWATGANLNVAVSFTLNTDQTFTLTPSTASFSHATLSTSASKVVSVTLSNATAFDAGSIVWTLAGGTPRTWTGATLSIDFADPANTDLLVPNGVYSIAIEARVSGVPYTAATDFELTITP